MREATHSHNCTASPALIKFQEGRTCVQVEKHANVLLCLQAGTPFGEISPVEKIIQLDDALVLSVRDSAVIRCGNYG